MPDGSLRVFCKPPLSTDEHIELLRSRGLLIPDRARAARYLNHIGYYRLSGYFLPFQHPGGSGHTFFPGTTFDQVLNLYIFDRHLRALTTDALDRIEIALRAIIANTYCLHYGPHWYLKRSLFKGKGHFKHHEFIHQVAEATGFDRESARNEFCSHYYGKYDCPELPPVWMISEVLPFGTWSRVYSGLVTNEAKKQVAKNFNLHYKILSSWMHSLTVLRNTCAHHSRVWNKCFAYPPRIDDRFRQHFEGACKYYTHAFIIRYFLSKMTNASKWHVRLYKLISKCPFDSLLTMGFPKNWHADPFWNATSKLTRAYHSKLKSSLARCSAHGADRRLPGD